MNVTLPTHWTATEAMAVYDFLEAIRDEIFQTYQEDIEALCWQQCQEESQDDGGDDETAFDDDLTF